MNFVIASEKGGVGKSMLAINVAAGIQREGHSVVLIDTDSTSTAAAWSGIRDLRKIEPNIPLIVAPHRPEKLLRGLASEYQNLVIDVGARDYQTIASLAKIAGYWLAPTRVSQGDMDSTLRIYKSLRKLPADAGGNVNFHVLLNATPAAWNSTEEQDAREYMSSDEPNMPILSNTLRERRAWRDVGKSGHTIYELPRRESGKAIDEFTAVFAEIMASLLDDNTAPATATA